MPMSENQQMLSVSDKYPCLKRSAMVALDRAFASVCSFLHVIVTNALIQILGVSNYILGK